MFNYFLFNPNNIRKLQPDRKVYFVAKGIEKRKGNKVNEKDNR